MKPEFLQLAQEYNPKKHFIGGWLMSEKLDGIRCFWDGGVSTGLQAIHVPWANTAKDKSVRYATGLWTRYGKIITAPVWFLEALPKYPLDGELWTKREDRQKLISAVKKHEPIDGEWKPVSYRVFDSPKIAHFLEPRHIDNLYIRKTIPHWAIKWWEDRNGADGIGLSVKDTNFSPPVFAIKQIQLPMMTAKLETTLNEYLEDVLSVGAEGIMLRNPRTPWMPERTWNLMKHKPLSDSEGTVVGFSWGKATDKGSRHLGRLGGLKIREKGTGPILFISGFTDDEREILYDGSPAVMRRNPINDEFKAYPFWETGIVMEGKENIDPCYVPRNFPLGSIVTFQYRGRSNDGTPLEARYWRKYEEY
jgi:DNA ligase-1